MTDVKGDLPLHDDGLDVLPKKEHPRYNVQSPKSPDEHDRHSLSDGSGVILESLPRSPPSGLRLLVLCVLSVLLNVVMTVSLPVFAGTMKKVGGDSFALLMYAALIYPLVLAALTLLLKVAVDRSLTLYPTCRWHVYLTMGLTTTLNGVGGSFASLPSRTAPYLQGILATIIIPFTVLCRFLLLRKGISMQRFGCTVAVLIGIFITVEPQIWSLPGSGNDSTEESSTTHVIWPMIFALGFLPAAVNSVLCERELKQEEAQSLSFITWTQVFQALTMVPFFWVDFIPFFGMASSFTDFSQRVHRGFQCNFSSAEDCHGLAYKGWIFILGYCLANLSQFLLIQRAEGAVFAVVVQATVTPLAALFWTFFKFHVDQDRLSWDPEFTETTAFIVGGLLIIVPAVVLYNVFSTWESREAEAARKDEG